MGQYFAWYVHRVRTVLLYALERVLTSYPAHSYNIDSGQRVSLGKFGEALPGGDFRFLRGVLKRPTGSRRIERRHRRWWLSHSDSEDE